MRHSFIDEYCDKASFYHSLDPRVKIITSLFLIISIILTPPKLFITFAAYFVFILLALVFSRIPLVYVLRKALIVIPFVIVIGFFLPLCNIGEVSGSFSWRALSLRMNYDSLLILWNVLIKAFLSVICMVLLISSTKYPSFLKGLELLKIPQVIILVLSFMYRYIFIIEDEFMTMQLAQASRSPYNRRFMAIRVFSNILGVLFIRSYERAESVYFAMCARRFNGVIYSEKELKFTAKDWIFLVSFLIMLINLKLFLK